MNLNNKLTLAAIFLIAVSTLLSLWLFQDEEIALADSSSAGVTQPAKNDPSKTVQKQNEFARLLLNLKEQHRRNVHNRQDDTPVKLGDKFGSLTETFLSEEKDPIWTAKVDNILSDRMEKMAIDFMSLESVDCRESLCLAAHILEGDAEESKDQFEESEYRKNTGIGVGLTVGGFKTGPDDTEYLMMYFFSKDNDSSRRQSGL